MISVNIENNQITKTFEEIEIGKFFVYRNQLFIKVGEGQDKSDPSRDPTAAIEVESGDEWVMDNGETVQRPIDVEIEVIL